MTFIMPLMSRSSEIIGFIVIWDRTGKTEHKRGTRNLMTCTIYPKVLQYAPRNSIITNRHILEYLPRYVLEYVPISYDKYRGTYRGICRLVTVLQFDIWGFSVRYQGFLLQILKYLLHLRFRLLVRILHNNIPAPFFTLISFSDGKNDLLRS